MTVAELREKIRALALQVVGERSKADDAALVYDELTKFPELKDVIVDLLTHEFDSFLEDIQWVAPKPTTFRIILLNGQSFLLTYSPRSWIAQVEGKKYYLLNLDEEEYALTQSISDLWEDYQVALLTRDFAVNKVVISGELLSIKKKERQLDQADAAAVTAAENALNDDKKTLISETKPFDLENLIKWKIVEGGMIPKLENCVNAVENGVRGVVILDGRKPHSILHEIFSDTGSGTLIRK